MDYLKILDDIILSDKVVENFHEAYKNQKIKAWIDELIPQIELCEKQQQNNPWHKYNVLDHILHSVEEMNKQTINMKDRERRMLAYTMLFHDIGKPATHIVREKNGVMIDSFFNHNKKSVEIACEILPKLGFNEEEINVILKLVYKHDIFMFITLNQTTNPYHKQLSFEIIEKEICDLNEVGNGEELLDWLVMVGRSDNLAQNENMTYNALKLLDEFEKMLLVRKQTAIRNSKK